MLGIDCTEISGKSLKHRAPKKAMEGLESSLRPSAQRFHLNEQGSVPL